MKDNLYTADSIESLDPREHVRLRPGMYAGDLSNPNQLLLEIFSNALDEHNIGHGNVIDVSVSDDGKVTVVDNGQGFPINEVRAEDGKTVLEASYSVMNTSGKFSDDGVYGGNSLGLNGIGGKLTNFLSKEFMVQSCNKGQMETIFFKDGLFEKRELTTVDKTAHGTTIEYMPDEQFFTSKMTNLSFFKNFFHDISCLCPKLKIVFNGEEIQHSNGIKDMLPRKIGSQIEIIDNPLIIQYDNDTEKFDLALTFTTANHMTLIPYVNFGYTDVGPHITAIKSTITRVLNNWAREQGLLSEKDKNLDGSSLQEGLVLVSNIVSQNVSYNAQVKTTITKMDTGFISAELAKELELWLDNHPIDGENIIEKALIARKASEAAKKARAAVKNKASKKDKVFKLPTTLTDCWTKKRSQAELLVCEGKSAASGLVAARDSEFQAVYGVRGKMLSVLKSNPAAILKNQEINNLIQALGLDCDYQNATLKYDPAKLRYGKIIACADAK